MNTVKGKDLEVGEKFAFRMTDRVCYIVVPETKGIEYILSSEEKNKYPKVKRMTKSEEMSDVCIIKNK